MVGRCKLSGPFGSDPRGSSCRAAVSTLLAMVGAAALALGCQDRECEAARLELTQTWQTLRATATSRQQIPEGLSLSQAEQDERVRTWKSIEERAELVRSSFETRQVTWPSADKARKDLGTLFTPLQAKDDPVTRGFAVMLGEADKRMATFRKQCN